MCFTPRGKKAPPADAEDFDDGEDTEFQTGPHFPCDDDDDWLFVSLVLCFYLQIVRILSSFGCLLIRLFVRALSC